MKVVLASNNPGKLHEFEKLFASTSIDIIPQGQLHVPEVDETGLTFVENAILKARNACVHTGLPAIADDTGLVVDALNGKPGIYSARFAGKGAGSQTYSQKLLEVMRDVPSEKRQAFFACVMVFMAHSEEPLPLVSQATWEGSILEKAVGQNGFGYDPVFYVKDKGCAAAQLERDEKNRISHRGKAMRGLIEQLRAHGVL